MNSWAQKEKMGVGVGKSLIAKKEEELKMY